MSRLNFPAFLVVFLAALILCPVLLNGQSAIPIFLGSTLTMLAPTVDGSGKTIVFGSAITPDGSNTGTMDLYVVMADGSGLRRLTTLAGINSRLPNGANSVSLSANAARAAYTVVGPTHPLPVAGPPDLPVPPVGLSGEEVHVVDVSSGADRIVAVDTGGCLLPLEQAPICIGCFFTCVNTPHITADDTKVLYSVNRGQPFYVVNSDGTGLTNLPVYTGALAPSPQRVISRSGLVAFTSASPSAPPMPGPTPIPASFVQDVYVMNLDGTNIRNVTNLGSSSLFTSNATISADGGTIVFENNRDPLTGAASQVNQIWLVHTDGSGLRALTSGPDVASQPSVSGDGSLVAFVRDGQISIVHSDGTGLKTLTNFRMSAARNPVISDDGSLVVFTIGPPNGGTGGIYAVNSDGSNLHALYAPHALNPNGIAGINFGVSPSPGSLFSAYGMNLAADSITAASSFPLPGSLGGVSLLVNGSPAPLLAVTPWQVNAQLPTNLGEGPAAFQFRFADGTMPAAAAADLKSISPGIFLLPSPPCPPGTGTTGPPTAVACPVVVQAAAFHANSAVPADQAHPAAAGEVLEIYGTGLGVTNPFVAAGSPAPASPPAQTVTTPQVLIGNLQAQATFAGLTPGLAGVYQVDAIVPAGLRSGQQNIQWKVGETTSNFATITVQ